LLQPRTAGPARRPQGAGERAAARRHQRRQGADQERLLPGARRAGEQVHADDEGGQARPPGKLARSLREAVVLVYELQSPERQAAEEEAPAAAGTRLPRQGRQAQAGLIASRAIWVWPLAGRSLRVEDQDMQGQREGEPMGKRAGILSAMGA